MFHLDFGLDRFEKMKHKKRNNKNKNRKKNQNRLQFKTFHSILKQSLTHVHYAFMN